MSQGVQLNTVTFSEMTDLVSKIFVTNQQMYGYSAKTLFISMPIQKGTGNTRRFDEVDTETFANNKPEGTDAQKAKYAIGYNKTMTKKRIAKEAEVTFEMRDENKYPEVQSLLTNLTHFCPQRIELDLTHRLTFSNAASYTDMDGATVDTTGGDSLAIVSTAHTLKYSSATWSNSVPGNPVFSQGALEAAELLTTTDILSNFGEQRTMSFNTLFTSNDPNTVNAVRQILQSTADIDSSNSGAFNVNKGKYRHVILDRLATTNTGAPDSTKRRWWGIASTGVGMNGWQAYYGEWEAPNMKKGAYEDPHSDNWYYNVRAGYGIVVVTGRGLIMSQPSS